MKSFNSIALSIGRVTKALDPNIDREEAIIGLPSDKIVQHTKVWQLYCSEIISKIF